MNRHFYFLFLAAVVNSWLGIWVWAKGPRDSINRYFGIFALSVAAWTVSNGLVNLHAGTDWGSFWARLAFASASLISMSLFLFTSRFPTPVPHVPKLLMLLTISLGTLALLTSLTSLIVRSTNSSEGVLTVMYGPLHPAFGVYFILSLSYSLFSLVRKLRLLKGSHAIQVRYVFLGALIAGGGGTLTNLLIPLVFGTSRFNQYGPLFSLVMVAIIAHAIIRHRLMDIRVFVRKGVVYFASFVVAGTLLTGLIAGSNLLFPEKRWRLSREIFLGLVVAALFHPLKSRIQHGFDRYLYRGSYNYQKTIRRASQVLATMLELQPLLAYLSDVIGKTMRPEFVSVYLRERDSHDYQLAIKRSFMEGGTEDDRGTITGNSSLASALKGGRTHLIRDDLRHRELASKTRDALKELAALSGELALPLLKEDQLIGFVLVGPKLSGDPYFSEDLDLVSTLASQAAIAVTNAQLYAEVVLVNEYVQNILKTMESGVIAVSSEGRVTLFNPAAERMTGLDASNVRSAPVDRLPRTVADLIRITLADGVPRLQVETTLTGADGQTKVVVCSTSPFSDAQGRMLGAVLVFSDLTWLKELEGEKHRAARLASFQSLASGIAHEIKNPLVAIKAFAQLLPKKFGEADFRENFSRVAAREVDRIDDLVERLRVLATPPKPLLPLDLREPIQETLELLHAQLEDRRLSVTRVYDDALPSIMGEPAQLKQLFLNFFLNAIEAMEPGGVLTIRLKGREGGTALHVEVSDTGPGISPEALEKIFDPFFSTKTRGTGLGLAICRGIADAHRATIRAENNLGAPGTTFSLTFPAAATIPSEVRA